MSHTITYINSNGESFNLRNKGGLRLKTASFHKYSWNNEATEFKYGELLKTFTKSAQMYELELVVQGTPAQRKAILNSFHDATEHDIMLEQIGQLIIDDYYTDCYIIDSDTQAPDDQSDRTTNIVTAYCPYPFWMKETKYSISSTGEDSLIDAIDFPFDFPTDLGVTGFVQSITVDTTIPLDFRMEIKGPVDNPAININGHIYEVDVVVGEGSTLVISSVEKNDSEKAVKIVYPSGNSISVFNYRNRDSYIFEPIVGTEVSISCEQNMNFDLYLIERRSEVPWT